MYATFDVKQRTYYTNVKENFDSLPRSMLFCDSEIILKSKVRFTYGRFLVFLTVE